MICSSCRRTLFSRFRSLNLNTHTSSSSTTLRYASSAPATPNDNGPIPAPASISLTQPAPSQSSTSPSEPASSSLKKDGKTAAKPRSSMPGGKELKGLGYTKAKPRVIAMEDDEYPPWLWGLLDVKRPGAVGEKVDLTAMTKKQRQRHDKKQERLLKDMPVQIPLHEQSKDITGPGDDAITSFKRRQEITKSARFARRRSIREANFLKSM